MHLKGRWSINVVVLVVILLFDDETFLVREEDIFVPVLSVPLRRRSALVSWIFKAGARRCPFERRRAVVCRSSLTRHDLIGSICSALGT
jgi:hypothetical protein